MPRHQSIHPDRGRQLLADGTPSPAWLERDDTTGCLRWLGSLAAGPGGLGGTPQAEDHAGARRNLRRDAWVRAHGPIPSRRRVVVACGDFRCLEPSHLRLFGLSKAVLAEIAASKHHEPAPAVAARLGVSPSRLAFFRGPGGKRTSPPVSNAAWRRRRQLPAERPAAVSEADWAVVRELAAGKSLAAVAAEIGVSRQMVHHRAKRALRKLGLGDEAERHPEETDPRRAPPRGG